MVGGVVDGSPVDAANTDSAFLFKNSNDYTIYQLGVQAPTGNGPILYVSIQQALNTLDAASGCTETYVATVYGAPASTILNGDTYQTALYKLAYKFDPTVGHYHTGSAGDGPMIAYSSITGTQLSGWAVQGTTLTGVTGSSTNVSTQLSGIPVSSGQTVEGVVVYTPYNLVILFDANGNSYLDALGNKVYGRITNSGGPTGTWTLSYYSEISGVETSYSFLTSSTVQWYYQQLYSEGDRPVFSPTFVVVSDQVAGDIPTATTTLQGKTQLSNTAPPAIAATGSAGTANATVANSDHTHAGVTSVNGMQGAVTLSTGGGGGGTLSWLSDFNSATFTQQYSMETWSFVPSQFQRLYSIIRVPTSYTAGDPINLKTEFFTTDTSNNWAFKLISYLIRPGTDAINSTSNSNTSTASGSLSGSTSNSPISMTLELDNGSGEINSIAIQPGYLILMLLEENGSTNTNPLNIPIWASEVTFS